MFFSSLKIPFPEHKQKKKEKKEIFIQYIYQHVNARVSLNLNFILQPVTITET